MTEGTFATAGEARTYAAIHGINFDNQDDYCDACNAFHVGLSHTEAVPNPCGRIDLQGYNTVLECARPAGHDGSHSNGISSWNAGA